MSLVMGLKAAKTALTLGNRLYTGYTLGKKLAGLGSKVMGRSSHSKATPPGTEVNNMIYNKSNLGNAQFMPMGLKRINSMRKSSLEKR
jgi:hypothetical protein